MCLICSIIQLTHLPLHVIPFPHKSEFLLPQYNPSVTEFQPSMKTNDIEKDLCECYQATTTLDVE